MTTEQPKTLAAYAQAIYWAYPRHVAPKDARRAAEKAVREKAKEMGISIADAGELILGAVREYAESQYVRDRNNPSDRHLIPHPATWLNRGSYDEDREEWGGAGASIEELG